MQSILNLEKEAKQAFAKADHLVYMTYPVVKEVKLLYTSLESLHTALLKSLDALLLFEAYYKRISLIPKDLNSKLIILKDYCVRKHGFDPNISLLLMEINKIVKARKQSPMEFVRKNKFVICSNDYNMKVIDEKTIKKYLTLARPFITKVGEHINGRRRQSTQ